METGPPSECELLLRRDYSAAGAEAFAQASFVHFISLWRSTEEVRAADPLRAALAQLPQESQKAISAGFEYIGRPPLD
jgi:hypothetical protein